MYHGRWAHFSVDAGKLPVGAALDIVGVVVHLRFIAALLILMVGGDPGIGCHPPPSRGGNRHGGVLGQGCRDFRYSWHFFFAHLSSICCLLRSRASGVQHSRCPVETQSNSLVVPSRKAIRMCRSPLTVISSIRSVNTVSSNSSSPSASAQNSFNFLSGMILVVQCPPLLRVFPQDQ